MRLTGFTSALYLFLAPLVSGCETVANLAVNDIVSDTIDDIDYKIGRSIDGAIESNKAAHREHTKQRTNQVYENFGIDLDIALIDRTSRQSVHEKLGPPVKAVPTQFVADFYPVVTHSDQSFSDTPEEG